LADLAAGIDSKFNHKIKYIDLGGGFASKNTLKGAYLPGKDTCPSFDDYADAISAALISSNINPQHMPMLILETGRALIDDSAYLLSSVIANKRLADGRKSMIIDAGLNNLFTSQWYDHEVYPAKETGEHKEDTTIYGPLCMNIDIIRTSIHFPPLAKGDIVVIPRVGAYNMTQWLQFITLRPKIVMIDSSGKTHVIRENESLRDVAALEKTPDFLVS
jgi:diaminopimelate decarboxylase